MTVTVNVVTENVRTGTTSPQTFSHAAASSGVKGVLLAIMHGTSSTDHVSAASYGGVALTRVQRNTDTSTEPGAAEWWFLGASVPQGTQTVSYTCGSTTDDIHAVCVTLLAAADLVVLDVDGVNNNVANPSVTLQYAGRSCMAFGALYSGLTAITSLAAGANCTAISTSELTGNFCSYVVRQTTAGTADFAVGVTSATDDVAFAAVAVTEKQTLTQTSDYGSFTLTGQAATLTLSYPGKVDYAAPLPSLSNLFAPGSGTIITAAYGGFTETGQAANLLIGHQLAAAYGTFTESGQAALFLKGRTVAAAYGTFTHSGQSATFALAHKVAADYGSVALTGNDAGLSKTGSYSLAATYGPFALAGQDVNPLWGRRLVADYGARTLTGQAINLLRTGTGSSGAAAYLPALSSLLDPIAGSYLVAAAAGSFALTGQAAAFLAPRKMTASPGSFNFAGQIINFGAPRTFTAATGYFTLTGAEASRDLVVTAAQGSFSLAGQVATLTRLTGRTLIAANGGFNHAGQATNLFWGQRLTAATGSFAETGQTAALVHGYTLAAAAGTLAETGQAIAFSRFYRMAAAAGSFAESGSDAAFLTIGNYQLLANSAIIVLTGEEALFPRGNANAADVGSFSLTGQSANLLYGRALSSGYGSFAFTGEQAGVYAPTNRWINVDTGWYVLTGSLATLIKGEYEAQSNRRIRVGGTGRSIVLPERIGNIDA